MQQFGNSQSLRDSESANFPPSDRSVRQENGNPPLYFRKQWALVAQILAINIHSKNSIEKIPIRIQAEYIIIRIQWIIWKSIRIYCKYRTVIFKSVCFCESDFLGQKLVTEYALTSARRRIFDWRRCAYWHDSVVSFCSKRWSLFSWASFATALFVLSVVC